MIRGLLENYLQLETGMSLVHVKNLCKYFVKSALGMSRSRIMSRVYKTQSFAKDFAKECWECQGNLLRRFIKLFSTNENVRSSTS